ncbi:type I restriction-modification system subunit M N-terminal domain-containing protein [Mycolicibacterium litorale]|uniref:type I restriction-modification system subunit M N-terminal domain-containing protein n=1 Tax=Mycolicibacterium litorale TaxID=758802 RepID=UPI00399FEAB6
MARAKKVKTDTRSLEQRLWAAADELRGNQEPSEYKHVVLGLVFLKYISDRFEERRLAIEAALADPDSDDYIPNEARRAKFIEDRDEYTSHNVFWVPPQARWQHIQDRAKLPSVGQDIDTAMDLIEKENPSLRGVLPRNYGREGLDKERLGRLVDLIGSIGFTTTDDHGSDDVLGRVYEYFLGQFAGKETGKDAGSFYTPRSVVRTLVEMLEPFKGRVYDPSFMRNFGVSRDSNAGESRSGERILGFAVSAPSLMMACPRVLSLKPASFCPAWLPPCNCQLAASTSP